MQNIMPQKKIISLMKIGKVIPYVGHLKCHKPLRNKRNIASVNLSHKYSIMLS